jgi:hypothetical protein
MSKAVDEFATIFSLVPCINILNLNINNKEITDKLNQIVTPFDGKITTIKSNIFKECVRDIKRSSYDYGVVVDSFINSDNTNNLFKLVATSIRDAGYIIIIEDKEKDLSNIYDLLEKYDFGAISQIDIFKNSNLIIGKKLHMWGMN